jgi:Na+-transporting methylmalonyl-CoA/oxaloacetate decarboxylase gamma subunit
MSVISEVAEKTMTKEDKILNGLLMSFIGVIIVFFVLLLLVGFIYGFNWFFSGRKSKNNLEKSISTEKNIDINNSINNFSETEITPELIAVITAAVQVACGPCTKIKTVVPTQNGAYGMQSKINIMSSHVPNKSRGL